MKEIRTIKKITQGRSATDGAGVKLTRVFGFYEKGDFDPFLLLDTFDSRNSEDYIKGFPWHPHRGIETITYLIEGLIEHGDSLGNKGTIRDGDCQWMTAGSGIIHQEMPKPSSRLYGAQLWLNLPKKHKMTEPQYGDILKENVLVVEENNAHIHIIAGEYNGQSGAFTGRHIKVTYLDVEVMPESSWSIDTIPDNTVFIYIMEGSIRLEKVIHEKTAILFDDGEKVVVHSGKDKLRFLFLSAPKFQEPIAWGGPIVMNTRKEIQLAFEELENNIFLKHN